MTGEGYNTRPEEAGDATARNHHAYFADDASARTQRGCR